MKIYKINKIDIHSFETDEFKTKLSHILLSQEKPHIITTFNLDFLRISEKNKDFLHICKNSLWNLPDGIGITYLIRLKYKIKIKRITGNDIFPILLKLANKQLLNVALIGSSEEALIKVREIINRKYGNLKDRLLTSSPPINFEEDEKINREVVQEIITFKPDIVFAALGCPRQELWLWQNMGQFKSKINIGVGAVFDYYSGTKKRSPNLLQKLSLEWLWRLACEPRRLLRRYVINDIPFFIKKSFNIIFNR